MHVYKSRSQYRTRTVRSITKAPPPIICKHFIDIQVEDGKILRDSKKLKQSNSSKLYESTLVRIIRKLKKNNKSQDILLMITPASRHPNIYKLHVIQRLQQGHLGMISIKQKELDKLRSTKAFHKYCIVFASQHIDLLTVVSKKETIHNLVNAANKKCCSVMKNNGYGLKSYTSSAPGDYCDEQLKTVVQYQDSIIQTDAEEAENIYFTLTDILVLIDTINNSLEPSKDLHRFFNTAAKLKLSLIIRPDMFLKPLPVFNQVQRNLTNFYMECYLTGNSYIGTIPINHIELLNQLELYPNLLCDTHVINDVYDLTPLPKKLVDVLQKIFYFLRMELLYDSIGEFLFDWYKHWTYI